MIKLTTSREIGLASRPKGIPTAANFTLTETTLPPLQTEQVLVQNLFMSVDPTTTRSQNPVPLTSST